MYGHITNKNEIILLQLDAPFMINGTMYPNNWLRVSSTEDKKAINIYPVVEDIYPNTTYFDVIDATYEFRNDQIYQNFNSRPKAITSIRPIKISEIKIEAQQNIGMIVSNDKDISLDNLLIKEINMLARMSELLRKGGNNLTVPEQTEVSIVTTIWDKIKSIRDYSNTLEDQVNAMDFDTLIQFNAKDANWPI